MLETCKLTTLSLVIIMRKNEMSTVKVEIVFSSCHRITVSDRRLNINTIDRVTMHRLRLNIHLNEENKRFCIHQVQSIERYNNNLV